MPWMQHTPMHVPMSSTRPDKTPANVYGVMYISGAWVQQHAQDTQLRGSTRTRRI